MPEINVGDAIGAGFSLIRQKPLVVWAWGGVTFGLVFLVFLLMGSTLIPMLARGGDPEVFSDDPGRAFAMMAQMQGASLLLNVASLVLQSVILAAVYRAILRPAESRWAYMRLGMAEVLLIALRVGFGLVVGLGALLVLLPFIIAAVGLGVSKQVGVAILVGAIGVVVVMVGAVYLSLRIALAGPMIVADNEFRLMESWQLTKGRVGSLFLIGLLMVLILAAMEIVLVIVFGGAAFGILVAVAGGFSNLEGFFRQGPAAIMGALAPIILGVGVVGSFVAGCVYAIVGAPWAEAYRQLAPPDVGTFG